MYALPCKSCLRERELQDGVQATVARVAHIKFNPRQRYVCPDCKYSHTESKLWNLGDRVLSLAGLAFVFIVAGAAFWATHWEGLGLIGAVVGAGAVVNLTERFRSRLEDELDPADFTGWVA